MINEILNLQITDEKPYRITRGAKSKTIQFWAERVAKDEPEEHHEKPDHDNDHDHDKPDHDKDHDHEKPDSEKPDHEGHWTPSPAGPSPAPGPTPARAPSPAPSLPQTSGGGYGACMILIKKNYSI